MIVRKYRIFINFDKEEQWLEEMALKGFIFKKITLFGTYIFESAPPQNLKIRIDYRSFKNTQDFEEYIQLFQDSGWRHIYGTKFSKNQYFTPNTTTATNEIFSDSINKAARYHRLAKACLLLAILCFFLFMLSVMNGSIHLEAFWNPKALYFTPNLWERSESEFWKAFLFETPFALLRGLLWLVQPILFSVSLYFAIRAYLEEKKIRKGDI